jgi:hypothetical protein
MDTKTELKSERRIGREGRPAEPSSGRWPFDRDVNLPLEVDSRAQAQHASVVLGKHQHEALGDRDQYQPLAQYSEEHATVGQLDERTDGGRRLEAPGTTQTDVVVEPERVQRLEVSPVRKKPKLDEATNSSFALDESFLEERKGEDGIVRRRVGDHEKTRDLRWSLLEPVSDHDIKRINQSMIHAHRFNRQYYCVLCSAKLGTTENLLKHIVAVEHERRVRMYINWSKDKERHPFFLRGVCSILHMRHHVERPHDGKETHEGS